MIREVHAPIYDTVSDTVIAEQDVLVPGRVLGVNDEWGLHDERITVTLICHDTGSSWTAGLFIVHVDEELPGKLDLALKYGPQARYLGRVQYRWHVFVGPAKGQPVGL